MNTKFFKARLYFFLWRKVCTVRLPFYYCSLRRKWISIVESRDRWSCDNDTTSTGSRNRATIKIVYEYNIVYRYCTLWVRIFAKRYYFFMLWAGCTLYIALYRPLFRYRIILWLKFLDRLDEWELRQTYLKFQTSKFQTSTVKNN